MERALPGCVDWSKTNVEIQPNSRFDKFGNSNYAMTKEIKQLPFAKIVVAKGEDFNLLMQNDMFIKNKLIHFCGN